jgi:hypothetical protein
MCGVEPTIRPTTGPYFSSQLPDMVRWICFRGMKGIEPSIGIHGGPEENTKHTCCIFIFHHETQSLKPIMAKLSK